MKRNFILKSIFVFVVLMTVSNLHAQLIRIEDPKIETYESAPDEARIEFYSEAANLIIKERNIEKPLSPEKTAGGKYLYSCPCDLLDRNKFGFDISIPGKVNTEFVSVYIEEGQLFVYNVTIDYIKIEAGNQGFSSSEDTAKVRITSAENSLKILSPTGEAMLGPVLNGNNTYDYEIHYNLKSPESLQIERYIDVSAGGNSKSVRYSIGKLSPKQLIGLIAIILESNCYEEQINQINQFYRNGNYRDAALSYRKLLETNDCRDKPADLREDNARMKKAANMFKYLLTAQQHWDKAEQFDAENRMDSCLYYHSEAYKWRNLILKDNPSDTYCLEYNRKFDDFRKSVGRIVSGKVFSMLDVGKPVEGAYIFISKHEKKIDMVTKGKIKVPVISPGSEINAKETREIAGRSNADGSFSVKVPRNTGKEVYQLNFTVDKEDFSGRKNAEPFKIFWQDSDADIIKNLIIKITTRPNNAH